MTALVSRVNTEFPQQTFLVSTRKFILELMFEMIINFFHTPAGESASGTIFGQIRNLFKVCRDPSFPTGSGFIFFTACTSQKIPIVYQMQSSSYSLHFDKTCNAFAGFVSGSLRLGKAAFLKKHCSSGEPLATLISI